VARRLAILGAGGHARAVADVALAAGWVVAGFTDRGGADPARDVMCDDAGLARLAAGGAIDAGVVGVGNSALARRPALFEHLRHVGLATPALVHPRAVVSVSACIGDGAVVFGGVVVGAGVDVGVNAVLYSGSVVEHGCRVGEHAYLSPGAILSGEVTVEPGAFVGAGAVVLPGVIIGKAALVAAGAVVTSDVPPGTTVLGVPARTARRP
jgi:sugar O-acyltransferase (sialic acid O-acetyltransferase NeuD family)